MAAAVLLSAEGPGPGVPGVPGSGPGVAGPASWNRSLDRALEEAAVTGFLNLSGRKLKEFPRSAANHDLTDTTQADLSRNRLSELPVEVCLFVSLESLNLYQNCIRTLPETMLNLQALTYLNISRNQLSTLPALVCGLPLKVLIACNNKLVSLPEEIGQLRQLTELDVSCNEIQMLPSQMGQLESLRDLNIRRNHLARLPPELAELPLVRLDFSCNKVTTIPVCYRNLRHLQSIVLDNNPLQSPPAQICIKGKIHIFKYLNMEACKNVADLPDFDRRPLGFGSCMEDLYPGRLYGALDSGFNSVDSGDKRWSGNEPTDELTDLPLRVAEITKEQRQRREREREESRTGALVSNGTVEAELEQIDFIDSCAGEDEEEESRHRGAEPASLSSQFMAYIERRITREGSPVKSSPTRDPLRTDDPRRHPILHSRSLVDSGSTSPSIAQSQRMSGGVERVRREAQIAALQYEEERQRTRHLQRDAMLSYVKHKAVQSPSKQSPTDSESSFPSRRSTHTDDSALFMSEDRSTLSPSSSLPPSALQSPSYPGSAAPPPFRGPALRPDSFLFRLSKREESRRAAGSAAIRPESGGVSPPSSAAQGEEAELVEQLRKSIESRLKVSLPSDLGAALTDGVVLCHLANHVRPRSVPSIHVPSPAVPKLTMAKCRRNVENFLEACRRIGVPQEQLCSVGAVLGGEGGYVYHTLEALLSLSTPPSAAPPGQLACFALFYLSVMSLLCALYCHLVPRF
ncbi:DISP complex protein LRCH3 isoform X7 [Lepisosteus oculatus]|uniref:DISP complex protein LRCH3 isoform X7 n=1 Tax=Lepisosteus oculatus TaxID=7918 RepID=UPI000740496B|nr:PREDICTED: leucine-rich repeat and calponin homology domain-containing protein 3 isoform X7 [Lepisosteus oculatus]